MNSTKGWMRLEKEEAECKEVARVLEEERRSYEDEVLMELRYFRRRRGV